jgi:hypothetical protein
VLLQHLRGTWLGPLPHPRVLPRDACG